MRLPPPFAAAGRVCRQPPLLQALCRRLVPVASAVSRGFRYGRQETVLRYILRFAVHGSVRCESLRIANIDPTQFFWMVGFILYCATFHGTYCGAPMSILGPVLGPQIIQNEFCTNVLFQQNPFLCLLLMTFSRNFAKQLENGKRNQTCSDIENHENELNLNCNKSVNANTWRETDEHETWKRVKCENVEHEKNEDRT